MEPLLIRSSDTPNSASISFLQLKLENKIQLTLVKKYSFVFRC